MARGGKDSFDEFVGQVQEEELSGTEVSTTQRLFTDEQLRGVTTFEDAIALAQSAGGSMLSSDEEIGNGFNDVLNGDDKLKLIGIPFVALSWTFNHSAKYLDADGNALPFVSLTVMTRHGDRYIVNDGSTGLAKQMRAVTDRTGSYGPMMFGKGLRKSTYDVVIEGRKSEATTFYVG